MSFVLPIGTIQGSPCSVTLHCGPKENPGNTAEISGKNPTTRCFMLMVQKSSPLLQHDAMHSADYAVDYVCLSVCLSHAEKEVAMRHWCHGEWGVVEGAEQHLRKKSFFTPK